jgi:spore coat polysaccharide biosynthesis protein SpsF (cytidylyltransferase family)
MKIAATIQARTGSTRLPNKVLLPILGVPMLARQVERIRKSFLVDEVIIATSTNLRDDPIASLAQEIGVSCFRGSEEKVLDRIVGALQQFQVDVNVECYGDCPLPDPALMDAIIGIYLKCQGTCDYVETGLKTTFPPGLDVMVYPARVLYDVAKITEDREHGAVNIRSRPERYRTRNVEAPGRFRYPEYHLEVDTPKDFDVITTIYEELYPSNPDFSLLHIIEFLKDHPSVAEQNRYEHRLWKAFRTE